MMDIVLQLLQLLQMWIDIRAQGHTHVYVVSIARVHTPLSLPPRAVTV